MLKFPYHITGRGKHNSCTNMSNLEHLKDMSLRLSPKLVVDVGAGNGFFGKLIKYLFPEARTMGIELCADFMKEFKLHEIYDVVIRKNILDVLGFL